MSIWAFIPARGGSESIPLKNLALLEGKPLINWALQAACSYGGFEKIVVSTDNFDIGTAVLSFKDYCGDERITLTQRPENLRDGKSYRIDDVVAEFFNHDVNRADIVVLIQPTSPFIRERDINECVRGLDDKHISSVQTIAEVSHNSHWVNQRDTKLGQVDFIKPADRDVMFNSGNKPQAYTFGNTVATRINALFVHGRLFCKPSKYTLIDQISATDIDVKIDLDIANAILSAGLWRRNP